MKKIILTTASVAVISTSAFADMMENKIYLRGDLGVASFKGFTTTYKDVPQSGTKFKSKAVAGIDIGIGYYALDNLRVEIAYNHPFINDLKRSSSIISPMPANPQPSAYNIKIGTKHKPSIHALFARVSGDIVDLGVGKLFLTAGLGWARIKNNPTITVAAALVRPGAVGSVNQIISNSLKTKTANNLAWTIGAGASFDIAEGVHAELAYSYRDYGKTKSRKITHTQSFPMESTINGIHFTSHSLTAGIRFDI